MLLGCFNAALGRAVREESMSITLSTRRWAAGSVAAATIASALLAASPAQAVRELFFEQQAQAFWSVPHQCADGSVVQGTLLVNPTYDYFAPDTVDTNPTTRVQFLAVCPDGTSFNWTTRPPASSAITIDEDLTSMTTSGSGTAVEPNGTVHQVTFDAAWTGVGPLEVTVNGPGSKTKEREAVATGRVTFDGVVLVDGTANHPTRPAPFIRQDTEK
jgi:hypothetical protein